MAAQSISQIQKQSLTLSPQQIQYIKLLQLQTAELQRRIDEELQSNPALEDVGEEDTASVDTLSSPLSEYGGDEESNPDLGSKTSIKDDPDAEGFDNFESYGSADSDPDFGSDDEGMRIDDDRDISDEYFRDSDYAGLNNASDGFQLDEDKGEKPVVGDDTLEEALLEQLGFLMLDDTKLKIGKQIIGTLDTDGYLRRSLDSIRDDLAFGQNLFVEEKEVQQILNYIQRFDPAGIAARTPQECLLLQLDRKPDTTPGLQLAKKIVSQLFEEFAKKHFEKIISKLGIDDEADLREAVALILKLNPKPGGGDKAETHANTIIPDFIISFRDGEFIINLNAKNAPELRVNPDYQDMYDEYSNTKNKKVKSEALPWVRNKIESARWFIDAIKQRQNTLLTTMKAIAERQLEFFKSGDDSKLRPMILKDIADIIGMDISTISRVANSKYVQTDFGTFPLKHFFSEGINTESGEEVSNRGVKQLIKEMIAEEDKRNPLSDDKLVQILNEKGFEIARRTVAKYREMMDIPVARLRRGF